MLKLALVQDLQSTDETVLALLGKIDSPELAFTKRTTNLEHAEVKVARREGLWDG